MIGTSIFDYVFIQACIYGLHYIAPLSVSYCLIQILRCGFWPALSHRIPLYLELWAVAETAFYLLVHIWYRSQLQSAARHPPAPSREQRKELFALCNANITDPRAYLRKWFLGAPLETIKRENLKEFFLWAFFNRSGPPAEDNDELEEYVEATEQLLGRKIEAGRGSAVCLRLTLDQVSTLHRSLVWYFCVGFVDFLTFLRLRYYGFQFHGLALSRFFTLFPLRPVALLSRCHSPAQHLTYWHRAHTSKTRLPVIFIHGIGIGLYPYVNFLAELNSAGGVEGGGLDDQVGIIAIEIMPVSFRLTQPALEKDAMCAEIQAIINHHGFDKYVLVSHSYGTAVATQMLKSPLMASQIGPVVLIDPITVLLHLPDVAYNFTRRQPLNANEHQLWYFASMDMGVSHTLARGFFWSDVILWKKDIGDRQVTVSLAERDLIVNTEAVGQYLASSSDDSTSDDAFFGHCSGSATALTNGSASKHVENDHGHANGNGDCFTLTNGNVMKHADGDHGHANGNGFAVTKSSVIKNVNNDYGPASGNGYAVANRKTVEHINKHENHANDCLKRARAKAIKHDWKSRPWQGEGLDILWQANLDHAQVFDSAKRRNGLINAIKAYSVRTSD